MGRIQSSIGLITGVPIADTVEQLIALSARPRDLLLARTTQLKDQQLAIGELTALVIGVQFAAARLGKSSAFHEKSLTSSNPALLDAVKTGEPVPGTYRYTPVRQSQTHQLLSSGLASPGTPVGEGLLSFRFGGFVDQPLRLEQVNGGTGVQRGSIRITDRSGASAVIDLRFAQTVDDVLKAINTEQSINVRAAADGDALRLIDETGQSVANLKVQEVGQGTTAADLGLAGIDVAASEALGQDVVRIYEGLNLKHLNDGSGIGINNAVPDLEVTFQDGSAPLQIDFHAPGNEETTVGELLATINAADPARLRAQISSDGDRIELVDLTTNSGGSFTVSSVFGGSVAEDLGLTGPAAAGVIAGRRLLSGLKTTLLSSLAGGNRLGQLGQITLTDRSGASDTVDLSAAETLDDVINAINAATVALRARVNDARNGIVLLDGSGGSSSNLVIANADATATADKLKIAFDAADTSVESGSLDRQTVSEFTLLSSLNHGNGVSAGSFLITDSLGQQGAVNLKVLAAETIGDVLDAINALTIGVRAEINASGDGIRLVDTAGGSGALLVADSGSGTAAADLKIAGQSVEIDIGGTLTKVVEGTTTTRIELSAEDTLQDLVDKINALDAGVTASIFNEGFGDTPYRLSLLSQLPGEAGELQVDAGQLGLDLFEISPAQDALLLVGSGGVTGAGVLASSSSNHFDSVLPGVKLTVNGESLSPVTIQVDTTDETLLQDVRLLVEQYNKLAEKLDEVSFFNEVDNSTGILFGSNEVLRIQSDLSRLVTGRFFGAGAIRSLEEVGVSLKQDGKLELDEARLQERFAGDPAAVEEFFTAEKLGFAAKLDAVIDSLAGEENSLLINRAEALNRKIEFNQVRLDSFNQRLDNQRERLLKQFYQLELIIGKLQNALSAVESIKALPPLTAGES